MSPDPRSPRQTKIIATLGPACDSAAGIRELIDAGIDVARLNFSHGDSESHRRFTTWVREASAAARRPVALMQDIQGPKIRVGTFPGGTVTLANGEPVRLRPGPGEGREGVVFIDYPHLLDDVEPGAEVLLSDGMIRLAVEARGVLALEARVLLGGELADHKGVAFPGSRLRLLAVTEKDRRDLAFGQELGVDLVAASFVRSAADVEEVARLSGGAVPVIAKIELAYAYGRLDEILAVADGAMVARGDLGVELPLEQLPRVQGDILARTNMAGKVSITATEMLESMTVSPRPTRAEVTDVAVSVQGGTDAVMLSAETALGRHPARAVRAMDAICREAERGHPAQRAEIPFLRDEEPFTSATCRAAVNAARALGLRTIVAFTEGGATARLLSKYRPDARIVAFTPSAVTERRMAMYWGVVPRRFERLASTDGMIGRAESELLSSGLCEPGEGVVMVAGSRPHRLTSTNLMKLHRVGVDPLPDGLVP